MSFGFYRLLSECITSQLTILNATFIERGNLFPNDGSLNPSRILHRHFTRIAVTSTAHLALDLAIVLEEIWLTTRCG